MRTLLNARRWIAVLCLAVLLIAALIPAASGLPFAILVPLWLFCAAIATFSIRSAFDDCGAQPIPYLLILSSRAPPIPFSL
jgi:hypothetical protein